MTNRQIAERMFLAGTVKNYVSNLLAKLDMAGAARRRRTPGWRQGGEVDHGAEDWPGR